MKTCFVRDKIDTDSHLSSWENKKYSYLKKQHSGEHLTSDWQDSLYFSPLINEKIMRIFGGFLSGTF